ncbi:MAG: response regulator transcription factor [Propioniciclava sp.]|uniref:response regulator n=1 Tax=Propioniciclava sp. TaxID=2038686 RepID=UPI0039E62F8E
MGGNEAGSGTQTRVMIVDDHEIVRRGLAELITRAEGLSVVAEASSMREALRRAPAVRPDIVLVDLQLPDGTGIDIVRRLRHLLPATRCLVVTSFDDDRAFAEAYEAGAKAHLLKTARGTDIVDAVRAVARGRDLLDERTLARRRARRDDPTARLTPSEHRVIELIGKGLSNREIGDELGIAEKTVKNHITSLLAKMGLQRRTQVAAWVAGQAAAPWKR